MPLNKLAMKRNPTNSRWLVCMLFDNWFHLEMENFPWCALNTYIGYNAAVGAPFFHRRFFPPILLTTVTILIYAPGNPWFATLLNAIIWNKFLLLNAKAKLSYLKCLQQSFCYKKHWIRAATHFWANVSNFHLQSFV